MTLLQRENVVLRPFGPSDVSRQREFFSDPELAWLDSSSPQAYAEIDVKQLLEARSVGDFDTVRLGIEVNGEYVGFCSLMKTSNPAGVFELGINIGDRRYWNQGLGKDVVRLLLRHGFRDLHANKIELTTNGKNQRAITCFTATGFTETKRVPERIIFAGERVDMVEMSIDAATWRETNT